MASLKIQAYIIQCLTNMHVGSGDANYGVVDKLIQRDPITNFPTIHSSSLKGALREHFTSLWGGKNQEDLDAIFGKKGEENQSGEFKFLGADLLALPLRSNFKQFALSFSPQILDLTNTKYSNLNGKTLILKNPSLANTFYSETKPSYDYYLEDEKLNCSNTESIFTKPLQQFFINGFAFLEDSMFDSYSKNLPVIARNELNANGQSKNLWYEEIVPHQTLFITYVFGTELLFEKFDNELIGDGNLIQIGGNASVGYGICKFTKIEMP